MLMIYIDVTFVIKCCVEINKNLKDQYKGWKGLKNVIGNKTIGRCKSYFKRYIEYIRDNNKNDTDIPYYLKCLVRFKYL